MIALNANNHGGLFMPVQNEWEVIVKYNGNLSVVTATLSITAEILGDSFAILTIPPERIPELHKFREIEFIELPKSLALQQAMQDACINPVQTVRTGGYGLRGSGVIIGIIDSGIDYAHPDFCNMDGTSRIMYIWDQLGEGSPPQGFQSGVEYNSAQLNEVLQNPGIIPSMDFIGHGTAVSGVAAGNGRASGGTNMGVAPDASLIVVRLGERGHESFARTTEIMRALKYIMDKAMQHNMPVAINLSFGTNNGSHAGDSLFETYINAVAQRWRSVVAVATGNEGAAQHHFGGLIAASQTMEVAFTVATGLQSVYLTLWKNFADTLDLELISPGGQSSGVLRSTERIRQVNLGGTNAAIYYRQPTIYSRSQEAFFDLDGNPAGIWRLRITGRKVVDGEFHIWLPTLEEVGPGTAFLTPDPGLTLTLPSTTPNVISVGGYNSTFGSAADFSGQGYTYRDIYVKPDLVAPAVSVLSTRTGGGYDIFTGTSIAAPFVAGAAALMMEWGIVRGNDPFLYGQRVKAFLQKGAAKILDIPHPNPVWGYGALCLKASMDYLAEYNR